MAKADVEIVTDKWSFDHASVHVEHAGPPAQPASLAMARHPMHPFVATVRDDGNDLRPLLFEVARRYLRQVPALAGLPLDSSTAGDPSQISFGWLALTWGDPAVAAGLDPRLSFWVTRTKDQKRHDRTAVLLAGNRVVSGGATYSAGGSIGLRVVLHVGEPQRDGRSVVRVTGLSCSGLESLLGVARPAIRAKPEADPCGIEPQRIDFPALRRNALVTAQAAFGFEAAPALTGIVATPGLVGEFVISGMGQRGPAGSERVYAWTAQLDLRRGGRVLPTGLIEQRSHAASPQSVMLRDPASHGSGGTLAARGPTRPSRTLDQFRSRTNRLPAPVGHQVTLADTRIEVLRSRVGNPSTPASPPPLQLPDDVHPLRSDDLAAAHSYLRATEFFARFDAYGLAAADYFKMARLPLQMRPRASFYYASNGETVNAQVSPQSQGQSQSAPFVPNERPQLAVAFGSANLSHREMLPNDDGRLRAQPLGLAADPRWAWHEFGHVLNFASTGELEFRFAHSAGDALAAITADPDTRIDTPKRVRDLTFPWAMLRRSHARPARLGWCWCGQRSRLRQSMRVEAPPIPGGYFEEELMSSSLFRLYEAVGGAQANRRWQRRNASDYTVYLIMRAIALLGPATVVPARTADVFVSALTDADIGTGDWNVHPTWPERPRRLPQRRLGGAVHKVIRWAFERQGLYATDDVTEQREGPGLPPKVDIHIPGIGARADGSYEPVALRWSSTHPMPWHADATSIDANGANLCRVTVHNRGSETADGVTVRLWASSAATGTLAWDELAIAGSGLPKVVTEGGVQTFSFEKVKILDGAVLGAGPYLLLAAATCAADRANTDPAAALPCGDPTTWTNPELLTHLVANDNNLGLRIVEFT